MIRTGLDNFLHSPPDSISGHRLGLLCNQASVDRQYRHARGLIQKRHPGQLTALFSPQHGFFGDKQDNMIESDHIRDPILDLPVFSLYGRTRTPDEGMLAGIDTLVVDLQDTGTRVYTFVYTLSLCMEAAVRYGKKVVVLDRPNPIGGILTEGNCLLPEYTSFVGRYPIPMRHGLSMGELARLFNDHFNIGCDLEVVPMTGWKRAILFNETGLPWVAPSPNLPTVPSTMVYPGQVILEGTNLSEGRGTTQPFELFGAPYLDTGRLSEQLEKSHLPGIIFREAAFEPTSNKWRGRMCAGFQIHVTDQAAYQPYFTSLSILKAVLSLHRDSFEWKPPPYEYEFEKRPIDLITGDPRIRKRIENLDNIGDIAESWQDELNRFNRLSARFHLYR